jgi:hypothetical protein
MGSWIEVYTRCMDGEYFRGANCPRDGHSNETSVEISRLVLIMRTKGIVPSLNALVELGFSGNINDVIVVEISSREYAPDWLTPSDDLYSGRRGGHPA